MTEQETVFFDPHGARKYPHIALVEDYLGGIGRLIFEDNTVQFAEHETYPDVVYSPRLPEPELEAFCKENLAKYEAYCEKHLEAMDRREEVPPIERFWEE